MKCITGRENHDGKMHHHGKKVASSEVQHQEENHVGETQHRGRKRIASSKVQRQGENHDSEMQCCGKEREASSKVYC